MTPQIVASECCAARFPPNTRAGFAYCLRQRFDGIEFDVHLAADGDVVVHHDFRLNPRVTRRAGAWLDAAGPAICAMTVAELRGYDVGRYRPGARELGLYPTWRRTTASAFRRCSNCSTSTVKAAARPDCGSN